MNENTTQLHPAFLTRMKEMLGNEYPAFLSSFSAPRTYGLRINTSKITCEDFENLSPFPTRQIPWIKNGYFYDEDIRPSRCPYYQAGLYYLQEPSAMTPASRIPIEPGDRVLDLCAAPGGKATAAGAALQGQGLLVANDISTSRARALLRNLELFGIPNVFVANETPAKLTKAFPEFFDKIILDAPCSGEGMFRKEEALAKDWTPEKSLELSEIQKELILQAADMLRPGGLMLTLPAHSRLQKTNKLFPIFWKTVLTWNWQKWKIMKASPMEFLNGEQNPELIKCIRISHTK